MDPGDFMMNQIQDDLDCSATDATNRRLALRITQRMNSQIDSLEQNEFNWPLAYEAEKLLRHFIRMFLEQNEIATRLAGEMQQRTGTDFYEWVDHFTLNSEHAAELRAVGLTREEVEAPAHTEVYFHPRAMMPRVLLTNRGSSGAIPASLAIRTESLRDLLAGQNLVTEIDGAFGAGLRQALVSDQANHRFLGVERLGYRGFVVDRPMPNRVEAVLKVRDLWKARKRIFSNDADGVIHALSLQEEAIRLVGQDVACDLFFAEERSYWESRNRAGQIQKRRQDSLGLGWSNHDHHTFRSSRRLFADLIDFLLRFGFQKRERYYAGAQAGWGAQILEHFITGITVFADVDLMPQETNIDFSTERLPDAPRLSTVGLWCALHGDSFLQAGMHHLEARFDFSIMRDQLAAEGVTTMNPFSDFPFLKQAFTEAERWPVEPERVKALLSAGLITEKQADGFIKNGAAGSHLENLQRKGGFKGFNQKSVSVIIEATDPRALQLSSLGADAPKAKEFKE
jgi:hypothetical protein